MSKLSINRRNYWFEWKNIFLYWILEIVLCLDILFKEHMVEHWKFNGALGRGAIFGNTSVSKETERL